MQKIFFPSLFALLLSLILPVEVVRADSNYTVSSNSTSTQYTLGPGNTMTVNKGVTASLSSNNAIVTVDTGGGTSTINNNGTINNTSTSSNARDIQINPSTTPTVIINNGSSTNSTALMQTAGSDVIHMKTTQSTPTANLSVFNYGTINALNTGASSNNGQQAIDLNSEAAGSYLIDNYNTGTIEAYESDPIQVPTGGSITINNDGMIVGTRKTGTTGSVDGINGETTSGQIINNGAGIDSETVTSAQIIGAHHGITADGSAATSSNPWTMSITNSINGQITGNDGSGINIDGVNGYETVTVDNSGAITGDGVTGDGDGVDVDGNVVLTNLGTIKSLNATASSGVEFSEGVTVGGGSIVNGSSAKPTALIEGSVTSGNTHGLGRGITLAGIDHDNTTPNPNPEPIVSIYEDSSITNYGVIKGDSESGVAVLGTTGGGHKVTITNYSTGQILGSNTGISENSIIPVGKTTGDSLNNPYGGQATGESLNSGAIELDDTGNTYEVDNYGTITQSGASGVAVAMHSTVQGATSNALNIYGGAINGDVSGDTAADSTLTFNEGTNPAFSFSHSISNFAVKVTSGTTQLTGTVGNTGATAVSGGKLDITGSMIHSATTVSGGKLLGDGAAGAVTVKTGGSVQAGTLADAALTGVTATHLASTQAASTNFKFSLTGLTLDGGSTLVFDLFHSAAGTGTQAAPAGGTMFDLGLTGLLTAGANVTAGSIILDFDGSIVGGTPTANNVYALAAFAPGTPNIAIADYKIQDLNVDGGGLASLSYSALNGQEVLDLTVAPEPGTWAMMIGGLGLLVGFARMRKLSA